MYIEPTIEHTEENILVRKIAETWIDVSRNGQLICWYDRELVESNEKIFPNQLDSMDGANIEFKLSKLGVIDKDTILDRCELIANIDKRKKLVFGIDGIASNKDQSFRFQYFLAQSPDENYKTFETITKSFGIGGKDLDFGIRNIPTDEDINMFLLLDYILKEHGTHKDILGTDLMKDILKKDFLFLENNLQIGERIAVAYLNSKEYEVIAEKNDFKELVIKLASIKDNWYTHKFRKYKGELEFTHECDKQIGKAGSLPSTSKKEYAVFRNMLDAILGKIGK